MQRTCDGTDPNLVRPDSYSGDRPCDCGRTFDDVEYSVVYPHTYIPSREEKQAVMDAFFASPEGKKFIEMTSPS